MIIHKTRELLKENGFTLIETIIVITILGFVSLVLISLLTKQTQTFKNVFNRSDLLDGGKRAIEYLRKDLHSASADSIKTMNSNELNFTNSDGSPVQYIISSGNLLRNNAVISGSLINNPFSYLDSSLNVTNTSSNLKFVKLNMKFQNLNNYLQIDELIFLRN